MTRNAVAVVSAVLFVVLAALLAVAPVPYVTLGPGRSFNVLGSADGQALIRVQDLDTYPTTGQLFIAGVAQTRMDAQVSLPEALLANWSAGSEVLPREWVYQPGKTSEQLQAESTRQMDVTQRDATVAALRAAGHPVAELPMVASVSVGGPAFGKLLEGDLITKVDGLPVSTADDVRAAVTKHQVGDDVLFEWVRGKQTLSAKVTTISSNQDKKVATTGVSYTTGYRYGPTVSYTIDSTAGGASVGLALALGVFDLITEGDLVSSRVVVAVGTIDAEGNVGRVSAVKEKLYAAQRAQASVFLVPTANCQDIAGLETGLHVVRVTTLKDTIAALQLLAEPQSTTEVPHC